MQKAKTTEVTPTLQHFCCTAIPTFFYKCFLCLFVGSFFVQYSTHLKYHPCSFFHTLVNTSVITISLSRTEIWVANMKLIGVASRPALTCLNLCHVAIIREWLPNMDMFWGPTLSLIRESTKIQDHFIYVVITCKMCGDYFSQFWEKLFIIYF